MTAPLRVHRETGTAMTRIIGGRSGGRRIATPRGVSTRPTSDRVREALFSAIESWCGSLAGLRFLDLYAGSGAVGLEAWSRGAGVVTLVEQDRRTAAMISANARDLGFNQADVVTGTGGRRARPGRRPRRTTWRSSTRRTPTPSDDVAADLTALRRPRLARARARWSSSSAAHAAASRPGPTGFGASREKKYGETVLWYVHAAASSTA